MKIVRMFAACGLLAASTVAAQEPKDPPAAAAPASTAQPGQRVPSTFRGYIVVDDRFPKGVPPAAPDERDPRDRTNKIHCPVCENGLSPTVAVFVRADAKDPAVAAGVGKLATALNKLIPDPDYKAYKPGAFVMFLKIEGDPKAVTITAPDGTKMELELDAEYPDDEKRDVYATEIRDLANAVKTPNVVFGLAPVKSKSSEAWAIGADDEVTVVTYNRLRVANRWKFKAADGPTDEQVQEIIAAFKETMTGEKAPAAKEKDKEKPKEKEAKE